jgi:glycosyltransferase involved in cell wall biosynthesis
MKRPLLSICIPTYNRASMLEVTLENILGQTGGHSEVEVVVSDNASTDHTQEVLARHPGLVVDRLERTAGIVSNIGHAVCHLAQGEYIWLLGDDDLVLAGAVERILAFLRVNPDLGYVYLNFGWIDAKARKRVVRECGSVFVPDAATRWKLDDLSTKILPLRTRQCCFLC